MPGRWAKTRGFTLIEMMVVVLVLAILLAIGIPSYLGARSRAQIKAAQANLHNAVAAAAGGATTGASVATDAGLVAVAGSWASSGTGSVSVSTSGSSMGLAVAAPDDRCFLARRAADGTVSYGAYQATTGCTGDLALTVATTSAAAASATYVAQAVATPDVALHVRGTTSPPTDSLGGATFVNGSGPLAPGDGALTADADGAIALSATGGVTNGPYATADNDALDIGTGSLTIAL